MLGSKAPSGAKRAGNTLRGNSELKTSGTPQDSTTTLTYLTYGQDSVIRGDAGLQSASAVLLFVVLLGLSFLQLNGIGKRVHYGT